MTKQDDNQQHDESPDGRISGAYRAAASERTPPGLDMAVLERSRAAVAGARKPLITRSLRPLAFAASLVLGVAVLYELQPAFDTLPATDSAPASAGPGATAVEDRDAAVEAAGGAAPSTTDGAPSSRAAQAERETTEQRRELAAPAAPAPDARLRLQESTRSARQSLDEAAGTSPAALATDREPALQKAAEPDAARYCEEDETTTPERWWRRIAALAAAGRAEAAMQERRRLAAGFPAFTPPE
ncbi:MAG: hypothetical protein U5K76_09670 [Woeseiaceae bacterium]|nr:hypothetical protein [Woeseiaceae bacterium]